MVRSGNAVYLITAIFTGAVVVARKTVESLPAILGHQLAGTVSWVVLAKRRGAENYRVGQLCKIPWCCGPKAVSLRNSSPRDLIEPINSLDWLSEPLARKNPRHGSQCEHSLIYIRRLVCCGRLPCRPQNPRSLATTASGFRRCSSTSSNRRQCLRSARKIAIKVPPAAFQ